MKQSYYRNVCLALLTEMELLLVNKFGVSLPEAQSLVSDLLEKVESDQEREDEYASPRDMGWVGQDGRP